MSIIVTILKNLISLTSEYIERVRLPKLFKLTDEVSIIQQHI